MVEVVVVRPPRRDGTEQLHSNQGPHLGADLVGSGNGMTSQQLERLYPRADSSGPCQTQLADRFDATSLVLRLGQTAPRDHDKGGHLGIDGIRFSTPAPVAPIGSVDFRSRHTGIVQKPHDAGAVAAGSLDPTDSSSP